MVWSDKPLPYIPSLLLFLSILRTLFNISIMRHLHELAGDDKRASIDYHTHMLPVLRGSEAIIYKLNVKIAAQGTFLIRFISPYSD